MPIPLTSPFTFDEARIRRGLRERLAKTSPYPARSRRMSEVEGSSENGFETRSALIGVTHLSLRELEQLIALSHTYDDLDRQIDFLTRFVGTSDLPLLLKGGLTPQLLTWAIRSTA